MSVTTDYLNVVIKPVCDTFFDTQSKNFNLTTNEGCGLYTEALVKHLRNMGHVKVGHLKKNPGQTQYNGHANDAFLYREEDPTLYRAVDIIGAAESTDPNNPPRKNFGIDEPRYTDEYWMATPNTGGGGSTTPNMVPWVAYNEQGYERLKQQLAYDYGRRPQGADFDVTVWAARVFHSQYFGPSGVPLGFDEALKKHRPEWCGALGVPVDDTWF